MLGLLSSCGFRRTKYDNPITKDTQQPDKVLFDKAISDMEKGRYEVARLTLQTLMNTYDTSEYLAKAKLAYRRQLVPRGRLAWPGAGGGRVQGLHSVLSRRWKKRPRRRKRSA